MAHRFWPNRDPLGKRFRSTDLHNEWMEVVGVVQDAKVQWIFADPAPFFFVPIAQHYTSLRTLQLRTAGDPAALAPLMQREIHAMDPDLPLFDVMPMGRTIFGGGLGFLGLVLALVGVYGVVSYAASQRTQEIGVRMALGADRRDIVRLVLGRGLLLVVVGIAAGVAVALSVSRLVANLLFNVSPSDPVTFVGVPLLLGSMALLASYVPARRATRIDPASALKA
jgi:ABC-type antimicrobial peptide transport system permease subunit